MINTQTISLTTFFLNLVKPYKKYIVMMIFIGFIWGINNSLTPYFLKKIIDMAVSYDDHKIEVVSASLSYVGVYILLWVVMAIIMRSLDWVKLKFFPAVRNDIITHMYAYLIQHSYRYFQNNFSGSLTNKISDMQSGAISIFTILDEAFAQCVGLSVAIIAMLLVHPLFALILLVWAMGFILISGLFFTPIQNLSNQYANSKTALVGQLVDSVSNVINVRLFSRRGYENGLIQKVTQDTVQKDRAMQWSILKMRILWDVSIVVLMGANIVTLTMMYSRNLVTVGDFTFIISLSTSIFYNLWYLASQFVNFAEETGKCKQALTILIEPHEISDQRYAKPLSLQKGCIVFDNVTFHYGGGSQLFKNKTVVIESGQKVGLVGLSGSGKSSFVNLMLRLYDVESGQILIDGQNIKEVTQDSLRDTIALIPQDVTLFHRSLFDNIAYGKVGASEQEVIEASKKSHCHEFISQLENGYQSLVGERGIKLSGGQRQRIAIARAILKNAPILILDEATSALDSVTEKLIQDSLKLLMQKRTTIVIAHRLSTLSEMDRILVFSEGKIIEDGTHDELIKDKGHYAHLWSMQAGGFLPEQL